MLRAVCADNMDTVNINCWQYQIYTDGLSVEGICNLIHLLDTKAIGYMNEGYVHLCNCDILLEKHL